MNGYEKDRGGYSRGKEKQTEDGGEPVVTMDKRNCNQRANCLQI